MSASATIYILVSALVAVLVGLLLYVIFIRINTIPNEGLPNEGFQGPSKGVSDIPCGQESSEAIALSDIFASKKSTTGDGLADLTEFKVILSKMCCMKHDLVGVSQSVQAALRVPFNTSHDRENLGDTVARCFTKSIPPRDLEIVFNTWKDRGLELLSKVCTSYNLTNPEAETSKKLFMALWFDVNSIAQGACLAVEKPRDAVSPRDPAAFQPENLVDLGPYKGYY